MVFYFSSSWEDSPFELGSEVFVCSPESQACKQGVGSSNVLTPTKRLPAISITYYEASAASLCFG